jgi:hypothetical protein
MEIAKMWAGSRAGLEILRVSRPAKFKKLTYGPAKLRRKWLQRQRQRLRLPLVASVEEKRTAQDIANLPIDEFTKRKVLRDHIQIKFSHSFNLPSTTVVVSRSMADQCMKAVSNQRLLEISKQ